MSSLKVQVGQAVRHLRKRKGLGQAELAERIDRSLETINKIERGAVAPSFDTLTALARALDTPVSRLFWIGDLQPAASDNQSLERLIERVSRLSEDDIAWVDRLVGVALARKVRD